MNAFALTGQQQAFAEQARVIAAEQLRPLAEAGRPGRVNRELVKAMGQLGLLPRLFPGQGRGGLGGRGAPPSGGSPGGGAPGGKQSTATDLCLLREALATQSTEAETALALQGLGAYPILQSGQEDTVRRWLPAVAFGDAVAAFALTEPEAGSDAAALTLKAESDGNGWRLTGEKTWISNAPEADVYTVFARTTPGAGARGVSAFAVPADRTGLGGEHLDMISPHPIGSLTFDGVRVERTELLGEPDRGFRVAMRTLDLFRPSVGAFAVGMAQAALDAAVRHAGTRTAFGGPLKDQQAVSHLLAEMATRTEAARLMVYAAAAAYDAGSEGAQAIRGGITARSAMAKLFATETAQFVVDAAVQIHGARALRQGHLLEHLYREVRAPRIYEGASEVQRSIIARELYRGVRWAGSVEYAGQLMDGVHDMGGMHGFGPVVEPGGEFAYHESWEPRVFAISWLVGLEKLGGGPGGRAVREKMEPARYLAASYYERWLYSAEQRLLRKGTIGPGEVDAMMERLRAGEPVPVHHDAAMAERVLTDVRTAYPMDPAPPDARFARGQRVRVKRMHPPGHTRCPRYARGAAGVIGAVRGADRLPDRATYGEKVDPEPVYSVAFGSEELWGPSTDSAWTVLLDLWESYLEPA